MEVGFNGLLDFMKTNYNDSLDGVSNRDSSLNNLIVTEEIDIANLLLQLYKYLNIEIEIKNGTFIYKHILNFKNIIFKEKVIFNKIIFSEECFFISAVFDSVDFKDTDFKNYVFFTKAEFHKKASFVRVKFLSGGYFGATTFMDSADFTLTEFSENHFDSAIFKSWVNFEITKFNKLSFNETAFHGKAVFSTRVLPKTVLFEKIILSNTSHIIFKFGLNPVPLKENNYNNIEIKIINTIIDGRIDFISNQIGSIDLKDSDLVGSGILSLTNFTPECSNYQTATILKNEALKRNNIIKALQYKAKEKDLYVTEKLRQPFKHTGDIISILLSKISNNHDQSWIQALVITLCGGFGLYYLFESRIDSNVTISQIGKDFFIYLIPTNYEKLISYKNNIINTTSTTIINMGIYFVGKILIAYGVVQTVKAFRKFNKTS